MISFKEALPRLEASDLPDPELVSEVFDAVLEGGWNSTQTAAFVVALRVKKETPEVIAAAAKTLRKHMVAVPHRQERLLDTCGTGGDGRGSLNLSSGAAVIAAAAGAKVAKHGNRAVSSKCGSADVFEQLGVSMDVSPERQVAILEQVGIAFLFAPRHHPAMRFVAPARKELGVRTLFNCLGPLANPAQATHQLLGAYDDALRPVLARTLADLGVRRAWVVRSEDGMDELSPFGPTRVTELDEGVIRERVVSPEDFGLSPSVPDATDGGDAIFNAGVLREVLSGRAHPSRDAFVLNAAGALCVYDALQPREATERVQKILNSGAALDTLERWAAATRAEKPV